MPMHDFRCCDCCAEFEELVSARDELPPCPKCGSARVEKLMSACAVQTGSGAPDLGPMPSMPPMGGCGGGGGRGP